MRGMSAELQRRLATLAAGAAVGRERAEKLSGHYRGRGRSREVVNDSADVLAYALSRMPATYAAVEAVLAELALRAPDFAPATLLDAGAGPGTAALAAAAAYPDAAATLFDHNRAFLDLARELAPQAETVLGELPGLALERRFDLVTCAYALTELPDAGLVDVALRLWAHTEGVLVLVEPGRPRDYERLLAVRAALLAAGAEVLAPCPHALQCPLVAPDWCHFAVRLARSREHVRLKAAALGYEDEKFSYLVVARPGLGVPAATRVIARPEENKFSVTLPLCTPAGLERRQVVSRDRAAFKAARKLRWGDPL